MAKSIILIGYGNIGKHYLEAIEKINTLSLDISIVDINPLLLSDIKTKYKTYTNISDIPKSSSFNLCIIATCSDVRKIILEQILNNFKINNLLLEKFLFPKKEDYIIIDHLINKYNINCWINCPRRLYPIYINLKNTLNSDKLEQFEISGGNWNIGSNLIHFIDIYHFLFNDNNIKLTFDITKIFESSRKNFYDFFGTVLSNKLKITNINNNNPLIKTILTNNHIINIININNTLNLKIFNKITNVFTSTSYKIPYLSSYMTDIIYDILQYNKSILTPFKNSINYHLEILESFNKYPIT